MLPCLHAWSVRRGLGQFLRLFLLRRLNIGARRGGRDAAGKFLSTQSEHTQEPALQRPRSDATSGAHPPSLPGLTRQSI